MIIAVAIDDLSDIIRKRKKSERNHQYDARYKIRFYTNGAEYSLFLE